MDSVLSFKERGNYGRSSYRGNCSGYVQKALFEQYNSKIVTDPMAGSFTTEDVCREMGLVSHCYDLSTGFNALKDEIPEEARESDTWFWHPPYGDIVVYSGNMYKSEEVIEKYGYDPEKYDLSRCRNWEDFISKLNFCMEKFYAAMAGGARMCVLMGDVKKKGRLYSMIRDISQPGDLEQIIIKQQHNCVSDRNSYSGCFVEIRHEYIMVLKKKTDLYCMDTRKTVLEKSDIRDNPAATWRDVIYAVIDRLNGCATLDEIYAEIEGHRKCRNNNNWKAKIRQILQISGAFYRVKSGVWAIV